MSHLDLLDDSDRDLAEAITRTAEQVHRSLLDNINTGTAMDALLDLVAATNRYLKQREESTAANSSGRQCLEQMNCLSCYRTKTVYWRH